MTKKLLSLLVAALLVLTLLPVSAMAAGRLDVKGSSLPAMRSVSSRIYRAQTTVYSADFESEPADWTFVDSDGDGYNWAWDFRASGDTSSHCTPHTDSGLITSQSYVNNVGALTPDNYAWSPSFTVPSTQLTYATFWYAGQDTSYFAEVFKVYLKVNGSNVAISDDITASGNYQQFSADISAYAGQSVQLGIRHYNVTDMFYLNIDDVLVFNTDEGYTPPVTVPEPVIPPDNLTLVYSNYYEEEADIENYSIYDADGDGDNWGWSNSESNASFAYEGIGFMFSASYGDSGALTPDNWLIDMNEFAIPSTGGYVSIYASGYDASYCAEHFGLVVGTVDAWTNEDSEDSLYYVNSANGIPYETGRNYEQYWFDLTDFAGETVYVAIRHFDCTDQLYLFVDQLQYWTVDEAAPTTHTVTFVDGLTNEPIATVEVEDGAAATAPDAPVHEGYTFTGWDVDFSNVTADLTVTAQYTINQYLVTFVDGLTGEIIFKDHVNHGAAATAPDAPVHEGYTFTGWDVDFSNVTADLTVTAQYQQNGPSVTLLGDVDLDGEVTATDALLAMRHAMSIITVEGQGFVNGDMDGDGAITASDAILIMRAVMAI